MADSPHTMSPSRRAFLARTVPVAAAFVVAGGATAVEAAVASPVEAIPTAPPAADPIFAVIAEHRAAQMALADAERDESIWDRADRRAIDAELPLFTTTPTTIAGVAALLEYVGSDVHPCLLSEPEGVTVLSYACGWESNPEMLEAVRTFPRRIGETLRSLLERG